MTEIAPAHGSGESPKPNWGAPRSKTVTWWWPEDLRAGLAELSGLEYLQGIIDGRFPPPPFASLTGLTLASVADGEAVFRAQPDESFLNPLGLVHGALLCTLLDSAMGVAVQTRVPAGVGYATIELKVSYLRPLRGDGRVVEATGRVLQLGPRVAFAEASVQDDRGNLVGHATSSLARVG
jgi:uncharacterized protein (TIGR00369 family)